MRNSRQYKLHVLIAILLFSGYSLLALGNNIEIIPRKTAYKVGEMIQIKPSIINDKTQLDLLVSYNNGPWVSTLETKQKSIDFEFKQQGIYSLQLNEISSGKIIAKTWLGQFYVGPTNVKYIKSFSWRPYKVVFKKGEKIRFLVDAIKPLNNLEFQISLLPLGAKSWAVAIPWHAWPLPDLTYDQEKPVAIMVSVRKKGSYIMPQSIWLGQFYKENADYTRDNLLSAILAHHRDPETNPAILDASVAKELKLAIYLLYWQQQHLSLQAKISRLNNLHLGYLDGGNLVLSTADGAKLIISLDKNTISDGIVTLIVDIKKYPDLPAIFKELKQLPEPVKVASLVTYFFYNHYIYSQVNDRINRPWLGLRDISAMCSLYAVQLANLLGNFGDDVTPISLGFSNGRQIIATHAVAEMQYKNRYYVLDATTGRVGRATTKSLVILKKTPDFIVFPQIWDAAILYNIGTLSIAEKMLLQPADEL